MARALVQNCITLEKTQIQAALLTKGHGRQGLTIYSLVAFGLSSVPLVLFRVITNNKLLSKLKYLQLN